MRAVLDVNILISALLSPSGAPAQAVLAWQQGRYELIASPLLLVELRRALAYPKLRSRIPEADTEEVTEWLARSATVVPDPETPPPIQTTDPDDDYLVALAANQGAVLVSGDRHVLALADSMPVRSCAEFLALLASSD